MQPASQPALSMELNAEAIDAAADLAAIYGDAASGVARAMLRMATNAGMDEEVNLWTAIIGLLERNGL